MTLLLIFFTNHLKNIKVIFSSWVVQKIGDRTNSAHGPECANPCLRGSYLRKKELQGRLSDYFYDES